MSNKVLIPFVQGNVFRHDINKFFRGKNYGLNPFRTGQCLSTAEGDILLIIQQVIQGLPKIFEELNS